MRDILDKLDNVLTEASRGLLYRSPGDKFIQGDPKNPSATIIFKKVDYFPSQPGKYDSYEQLAKDAQRIIKKYPGLMYCNSPMPGSTRAFAIITLDGPMPGQQTFICRFFAKIDPDMTGKWKNNEIPGGWQLAKATSLKASYGLKPTDFFKDNQTFSNVTQLVAALSKVEKVKPLMGGIQEILGGRLPKFSGQKEMLSAIQDDLGEILSPIALAKGLITDHGVQGAQEELLGGSSWEGLSVRFPDSKTNGLVDSYVYVNNVEIGISSKGNKGATASIRNVLDGVKLAREQQTPKQKEHLTKYAKQVALVEKLGSLPAGTFPTNYAVINGLLDKPNADRIQELISIGAKSLDELPKLKAADRKLLEGYMSRINAKTDLQNYCVGYHILSAVAKDVANHINANKSFGEACLYFVNINPIIQIYCTAKVDGDDVKVTKFSSTYPPNFQGTVLLDPGKNYSATGVGGRMSFAYSPDKNAALKQVDNEVNVELVNAKAKAKIEKVQDPHVDITPLGSETRKRRDELEPDVSAPRAKRK
jgi:hypothetical protein